MIVLDLTLNMLDLSHRRDTSTNSRTADIFQGATIGHGIKARTYAGQASSEFSHKYFAGIKSGLDLAWSMVEEQRRNYGIKSQARL